MSIWVYLNGQFLAADQAYLHVSDLALQRGYGIFDFFRLAGDRPVFLDDYLDRFYQSAAELRLTVPLDRDELRHVIAELNDRNRLHGSGIRLGLTGGCSEDGFKPGTPNLVITQRPFSPPTAAQRTHGITLLSYPHRRQLPRVKSIDYLTAVWLQPSLAAQNADDALYHHEGRVSECPRSNFFLLTQDDRLVTASDDVLEGITRQKVLALAKEFYSVEVRPVLHSELASAKEAFITSTTKQSLPVHNVDGVVFRSTGAARKLLDAFQALADDSVR